MKKLRFKRGISVGIMPRENITVPDNEYWKVLPTPAIAIIFKDGNISSDEPLFTVGKTYGRDPQTVILSPGTILYNIKPGGSSEDTKGCVIGIAFEEVESV